MVKEPKRQFKILVLNLQRYPSLLSFDVPKLPEQMRSRRSSFSWPKRASEVREDVTSVSNGDSLAFRQKYFVWKVKVSTTLIKGHHPSLYRRTEQTEVRTKNHTSSKDKH
jgi:hypothetical protein